MLVAALLAILSAGAPADASPSRPSASTTAPAEAGDTRFAEMPVVLGQGPWAVPGVLTMPEGKGPFPAVVLVHGFGPGTVDLDVGPNKVFKETAQGLAAHGVATLRYAKRPTAHRGLFRQERRHATVEEEWIDDTLAGVALVKTMPGVAADRVYVMGHSASAALAPMLANRGGAAGAIVVNAANRPAGEMIKDQALYVSSLQKTATPDPADDTLAGAERLLRDDEADDVEVLGHPLWYWRSLAAYNGGRYEEMDRLTARGGRVLVVQGARDYLTNDHDWRVFEQRLRGKRNVSLRRFPMLNHMMQEGRGRMTPAEYGWKKPVSADFTAALADWISSGRAR